MENNGNNSITTNPHVIIEIYKGGQINIVQACSLLEIETAVQRLALFLEQTKQQTMVKIPQAQDAPLPEERQEIA